MRSLIYTCHSEVVVDVAVNKDTSALTGCGRKNTSFSVDLRTAAHMEGRSKIEEYERFVNERLRTDLKRVLERRDAVNGEIAEFVQLKATIQHLRERQQGGSSEQKQRPLKTMVDLGCNFYAKGRVHDFSHIYVSIGLGFHLEMELKEAVTYAEKRVESLSTEVEKLTEQASKINARIKMVLGALDELQFGQGLQQDEERSRRVQ